ncbi:MAG TPA: sugar porter family MFS transporter [Woeseiaceae bacterium]|jgi:sugar porter (SP) family MFS transporter|nr:sugar porter family MFS transporter [Woeseiaceae bacterium]
MHVNTRYTTRVALVVAIGGFLMGFEASVVSGVVTFIVAEFDLSRIELGWAVASLTLTATMAMMLAGPLSDRIGRRPVLMIAALLFMASAIAAAAAPAIATLVAARMIGGVAVGAALIVAPMYIAEISPAHLRGRTVSLNQLNIVIGISAAFFSNYLILELGHSDLATALNLGEANWRAMLGIESLPALLYFLALFTVPESPRWLAMHGQLERARRVLESFCGRERAGVDLSAIRASLETRVEPGFRELFQPSMKLVLIIGASVAVLQQITGINAIFFYAPMIFEQSGIGTDASFMQAVLVGLVNLGFTLLAISQIDRLGRRPLLGFGLTGIAVCMLLLSYGFGSATYALGGEDVAAQSALQPLLGGTWHSDVEFRQAVVAVVGSEFWQSHQSEIVSAAIDMNASLILFGVLGFVASFAISIGPVMWVLFSELFPNRLRGVAISFVGFINSAVSFSVQLVFPWELERIGNSGTFLIYALFAIAGLVIVMRVLPETNGRSLEELEAKLVGQRGSTP